MADTINITPDLGWANMEAMLDPAQNPAAVTVEEVDWSVVVTEPTGYVGPNLRVIRHYDQFVELSAANVALLRGHNIKHYYKSAGSGEGTLRYFILRLEL